jgi:hypothetical protein
MTAVQPRREICVLAFALPPAQSTVFTEANMPPEQSLYSIAVDVQAQQPRSKPTRSHHTVKRQLATGQPIDAAAARRKVVHRKVNGLEKIMKQLRDSCDTSVVCMVVKHYRSESSYDNARTSTVEIMHTISPKCNANTAAILHGIANKETKTSLHNANMNAVPIDPPS